MSGSLIDYELLQKPLLIFWMKISQLTKEGYSISLGNNWSNLRSDFTECRRRLSPLYGPIWVTLTADLVFCWLRFRWFCRGGKLSGLWWPAICCYPQWGLYSAVCFWNRFQCGCYEHCRTNFLLLVGSSPIRIIQFYYNRAFDCVAVLPPSVMLFFWQDRQRGGNESHLMRWCV